MAGTLTVSGTQTGIPEGQKIIGPLSITMGTVGQITDVTLASGFNSISVPTTAVGCIIIPPTGNTVVLTLKGVTGDTGVVLSKVNPTMLTFDTTPPATFGITAASATSSPTEIVFF